MIKLVGKKELNIDLVCKGISDTITPPTKKFGVRTIRKVTFVNEGRGVNIVIKAEKKVHPLRHWNGEMLKEDEGMLMLLEVPEVKQKKITDFDEEEE